MSGLRVEGVLVGMVLELGGPERTLVPPRRVVRRLFGGYASFSSSSFIGVIGRGTTSAEDAQGKPTQGHISSSIPEYKDGAGLVI